VTEGAEWVAVGCGRGSKVWGERDLQGLNTSVSTLSFRVNSECVR
jgi:hypothetical protein